VSETSRTPAAQTPADLQADALVAEIARQVDAARVELVAAAAREVQEIRQRARAKARRQMRRAIEEMRATGRQRLTQAMAELETERGRRRAAHSQQVLALAWPLLVDAIGERWADEASRVRWIDAQIDSARRRFGDRPWTVVHPADWQDADVAALRETLTRSGVDKAVLRGDPALTAGLVIEIAGARLDSSPPALLADRSAVEAVLLAEIDRAESAAAP